MKLALGLYLKGSSGGAGGDPVVQMLIDFQARIIADGGSMQGISCLSLLLLKLNLIE